MSSGWPQALRAAVIATLALAGCSRAPVESNEQKLLTFLQQNNERGQINCEDNKDGTFTFILNHVDLHPRILPMKPDNIAIFNGYSFTFNLLRMENNPWKIQFACVWEGNGLRGGYAGAKDRQ